ncbi:UvrD-helicase domain-containing protein [Paraburkholderia saeva]|uniref:DNA 3'-5' helicase n=1 Tax=Paraburkholderia saeva TaxID=2777537 RepID=A0A9N8X0B2_9BURK|nr:UvrD-helicase domain-containing protein [Paraburkholderia saeva]CAG4892403.1 ATP-dependent DNA helicase Rep [Paraburkholderia saeva]
MSTVFEPTSWGLLFTGSRRWCLRLDTNALELQLSLDGKLYRTDLDGCDEPVVIHSGIFWSALTLQMDGLTPTRIDGLPSRRVRALRRAVADGKASARLAKQRVIQHQAFSEDYVRMREWLDSQGILERAIRGKMGWLPYEDQQDMLQARPKLTLARETFLSHLQDPGVRQLLPDALSDIEDVVTKYHADWRLHWVALNSTAVAGSDTLKRELFDLVEKQPLTDEQIRAVMCFDNRVLVVASAGSGKTSVMVAKAVYAVHRQIVGPDRILLLAFNAKAAEELATRTDTAFKRVGRPDVKVEARTFHSLGLSIIGSATGRKPNVPDWAVDAAAGLRKLEAIVDDLKDRSTEFRTKWDLFRVVFGRDLPEFGGASASDGWDRDGNGYVWTIRGERVRSHEERVICDWLFYNGVNYEYEQPYEFDTSTADHRQYFPDFYYPDIGLYHEHFALNAAGNPPPAFAGYLDGVAWKRAEHERRGTKLIETTSHQLRTRSLDDVLGKQLTAHGGVLDPNPDRPIPERGFPPMESEKLIALVRIFITHVKSNCLTIDEIRRRISAENGDVFVQRHRMFLEIVEPVLRGWDDALNAEGGIDFEDMLNQAAAHLESSRYQSPFELVMADEFQDASRARARLCRALVNRRGRFFFAVGDDWQSINRFAGSDISVMTAFADWFGYSEVLKLEQTFRCTQALCDVSSEFITKNPNQLKKKVLSATPAMGPVLKALQVESRGELQGAIDSYLAQLYRDLMEGSVPPGRDGTVTVFVLGRYNRDMSYVPNGWQVRYGSLISLSFLSIHRSKGAEADYVILPAMLNPAFPNTRADDPVLAMAMPTGDTYPMSEERRLFYVALTRARRSVALFTVKGETSSFLNELVKDGALKVEANSGEVIEEERCPACEVGVIVKRSGPYGLFEACSSYPRCEFKPRRGGRRSN